MVCGSYSTCLPSVCALKADRRDELRRWISVLIGRKLQDGKFMRQVLMIRVAEER